MTIALSTIDADGIWVRAGALALIAVAFTVLVYGAVALLVKIDDFGLHLSKEGIFKATRWFGRKLVSAMPTVLKVISAIGTVAMLWVGGSIVIHALHELHVSWPYDTIRSIAHAVSNDGESGTIAWLVTAFLDAVAGFGLGLLLIPLVNALLVPITALFPEK